MQEEGHTAVRDIKIFEFTNEEKDQIELITKKYPASRSAVMPVLWIAQEKYGWLSPEAIKLVAETLNLPFAEVYGVATFYTMYLKKPHGKHVLDVCTCLTCCVTGGPEIYSYVKKMIHADENGDSPDGMFSVRETECLGACDTAPVLMLDNKRYLHHITRDKTDQFISQLRNEEFPELEGIPLPDQTNKIEI